MPTPIRHNHNYWFILGREQNLSATEIVAVLNLGKIKINNGILFCETEIDSHSLITRLGGTIKIAKQIYTDIHEQEIPVKIAETLENIKSKIHFGISLYSGTPDRYAQLNFVKQIGKDAKKILKNKGFSIRYVENKEPILSSVTVDKNGLITKGKEFLLTASDNGYNIAITEAVQPFEEYSARDFGRPGRDDVSGMLPPKLAMMMINLASAKLNATILDPFCGSGTIITEAMLMGYENIIGADISNKATEDTKQNINWIKQTYDHAHQSFNKTTINILQSDVIRLSFKIPPKSINAIITEPFLGTPLKGRETSQQIATQAANLQQLYLSAFSQFKKILAPAGIVVFVTPFFQTRNGIIKIDLLEKIKKMGFTPKFLTNNQPLTYARTNQLVGRQILVLQLVSNRSILSS